MTRRQLAIVATLTWLAFAIATGMKVYQSDNRSDAIFLAGYAWCGGITSLIIIVLIYEWVTRKHT